MTETKTIPYAYRMHRDINEHLKKLANQKKCPVSYLVTAALINYVKENPCQ